MPAPLLTASFVLALAAAEPPAPVLPTASAPASSPCAPPGPGQRILLWPMALDRGLETKLADAERAVRRAAKGRLALLPPDALERALTIEGGQEEREKTLFEAQRLVNRAEEKFRELADDEALSLLAAATVKLTTAHQEPGGAAELARAHLLAGAIYLARGRSDAARQRLQRALDLDPDLSPPRDRYAPEVIAELDLLRSPRASRPRGRLRVQASLLAQVAVDGREVGPTPIELADVGAGNHVLRVHVRGYRSRIETINVLPAQEVLVEANLERDPEQETLERLPDRLARHEEFGDTLELLARRGGAARTLFAAVRLAGTLTAAGTTTVAVQLTLPGAGTAYAPSLAPADVDGALERLLACVRSPDLAPALAPAILGAAAPRVSPAPFSPPTPWWERPWFWAAAAFAAVAVSAAVVVARASGGPPDAVEVTLIPRP